VDALGFVGQVDDEGKVWWARGGYVIWEPRADRKDLPYTVIYVPEVLA
jgi:hypothetical protein